VMKESAQAAWTFARSHAELLGILDHHEFERDVHVHVPAGAIPKDGPSAGIAMATAIVSALSRRPARHDVAVTGEISLSGRVLPIGGLKEKVLGAVRAGIREFVIPRDNEADLDDLPAEVVGMIHVTPVDTLAEALAITLRDTTLRDGRLFFAEPLSPAMSQLAH
jgi:ATP-dependent Lon protease